MPTGLRGLSASFPRDIPSVTCRHSPGLPCPDGDSATVDQANDLAHGVPFVMADLMEKSIVYSVMGMATGS